MVRFVLESFPMETCLSCLDESTAQFVLLPVDGVAKAHSLAGKSLKQGIVHPVASSAGISGDLVTLNRVLQTAVSQRDFSTFYASLIKAAQMLRTYHDKSVNNGLYVDLIDFKSVFAAKKLIGKPMTLVRVIIPEREPLLTYHWHLSNGGIKITKRGIAIALKPVKSIDGGKTLTDYFFGHAVPWVAG